MVLANVEKIGEHKRETRLGLLERTVYRTKSGSYIVKSRMGRGNGMIELDKEIIEMIIDDYNRHSREVAG